MQILYNKYYKLIPNNNKFVIAKDNDIILSTIHLKV